MGKEVQHILSKVSAFKRKYYLNLFLRGSILTLTLVLGYFLFASLVEYNLWLGRGLRLTLLICFFITVGFCLYQFLREPLSWWLYKRGLGEEESAKMIGHFFPTIGDKLLNVLQLSRQQTPSPLLDAGIAQKTSTFKDVAFESAIDLRENKKYLKYLIIPFGLILLLLFVNSGIFTQSAQRIVQFNQEFSPEAPFEFIIENKSLAAFFNEDFTLELSLKGKALPTDAYLVKGTQRRKMETIGVGKFAYTFERIQAGATVQFEAAGFYSSPITISIANRPEINNLNVVLQYPNYLQLKPEQLTNAGNLEVPEGTKISWKIGTQFTTKAQITFVNGSVNDMQLVDNNAFGFSKNIHNPEQYTLILENEKSKNKEPISYSIDVIKDQFPLIKVDNLRDSILFKTVLLGGQLTDDYGITELKLNYKTVDGNVESAEHSISIPLHSQNAQQNFFYQWSIDSLQLKPGNSISYYLQVWDNDGVNGKKSTRSANYIFSLPSTNELSSQISQSQNKTESKIDESIAQAKELQKSIEETQQRLRGKQSLDWQEKKMLEDLVAQKQKLDNVIHQLKKENKLLEQKKEAFTEESERIKEKSEQIQKLMDELLDEETKKLFQELEKMLRENADPSQMQKVLDKMNRKEINLEKELERTLELFKQLQYDYKFEQSMESLKEQIKQQEKLLEDTKELAGEKSKNDKSKDGDKNNDPSKDKNQSKEGEQGNEGKDKDGKQKDGKDKSDDSQDKDSKDKAGDQQENQKSEKPNAKNLSQKQEEINRQTEKLKQKMKELEEMGEKLDQPQNLPGDEKFSPLQQEQQNSKESLDQNKPKKSIDSQKKSIQQMKQMQQQMESMQNSMEMEMDMANLESLRQIIHGLIKLSYDQESLMREFNQVQQSDPKYVQLSQNQLKVKDDSKVLEDSLLALSKKDPFLGSAITKEISELNDHLDKAANQVKERRKSNASAEMQFSMTSINNLALMLNSHYDMLMNAMQNAQIKPGKNKKGNQRSLSQMQMQLNLQMEEIRKGGKGGRQLSEELAKMAAEQERIRRALQEMQQKLQKEGGKAPGEDLPGKMEQTEMDLVNKQITEQTIRRQNEIMTRLLETEKSMREQNQDQERKGETAKDYDKELPRNFEEYLRLKQKEIELLKTVPLKLYPYYKKEVNEYFKRIGSNNN
jgi:hypothetical protein